MGLTLMFCAASIFFGLQLDYTTSAVYAVGALIALIDLKNGGDR